MPDARWTKEMMHVGNYRTTESEGDALYGCESGVKIATVEDWVGDKEHAEAVANAERLASCWNACLPFNDPERDVARIVEALQDLTQAVSDWRQSGKPNLSLLHGYHDEAINALALVQPSGEKEECPIEAEYHRQADIEDRRNT